ncbi:glycosyltransferase [Chryseosolibacter indicus]|uniref:Glycosyltransferase n=1 Tax=Chryseosolibacter indicus TaxID=2782351 RepID=A0ABS5VQ71_9BACT|nr:glycosyltransferase [Chryseosolibacter indicus]MBT1703588.1 glycosyltransferase [Chryseosolibacter indicus]
MDFCVLIPYHNDFEDLVRSVNSISYDTGKFCVVIVDDGSTKKLTKYELLPRIKSGVSVSIVRLEKNQGIIVALNTGLQYILDSVNCPYIARLDCGDICDQSRFKAQVSYLNEHPDIDFLGSWCTFTNYSTSESYLYKTPTDHEAIVKEMNFRNVFIHPTVMWRRRAVELYPDNYPHAEDYGLFYRQIKKVRSAILPLSLVTCKINPNGISLKNRNAQLDSRIAVVKAMSENRILSTLGILKIKLLKILPFTLVFQLKKMLSAGLAPSDGIQILTSSTSKPKGI